MKKIVGFLFGVMGVYIFLNFTTYNMLQCKEMNNSRDNKIVMHINEKKLPKNYYEFITIDRLYVSIGKIEKILFQKKDKIEKKQLNNGNKETYMVTNEENDFLKYNNENILYCTKNYEKISQYFGIYPNSNLNNGDMYNKKIDLSFATLDEAYKEIYNILEYIGVPVSEFDYEYYVIDYDSLKKVENDLNITKEKVEKSDECYFFALRQKIDSYPLINYYLNNYTQYMTGTSQIQLMYSKRGIEYLYIDKLYNIEIGKGKGTLNTIESIKSEVLHKYNQLLTNSSYQVNKIEFAYFVIEERKKIQCIPVWIVTIIEENGTFSRRYQEIYNAKSAKEIVI